MPQMNSVSVRNHADETTVFTPDSNQGGVAVFTSSNGVPLASKRLTMSSVQTTSGRRKVTIKFAVPVVQDQVLNGVTKPTVVRTAYADLTLTFDPASTKAERMAISSFVGVLTREDDIFEGVAGDLQGLY